jgi:hypothetical protein
MSLEGTSPLISDRYIVTCQVDTGATVTMGQAVYISAAGSGAIAAKVKPTDGARKDVIGVALTGGSAGTKISVVCRGFVRVVASAAITMGSRIISAASGKVAPAAALDAPTGGASQYYTTTIESGFQAELDKIEQWIGRALTAATNDGDVINALLYCIP